MPKYFYAVRDATGNKATGFEEAANQDDLVARLQSKGFVVINVQSDVEEGSKGHQTELISKSNFKPRHYRVSGDDLVLKKIGKRMTCNQIEEKIKLIKENTSIKKLLR